jgi:hypothetical protein
LVHLNRSFNHSNLGNAGYYWWRGLGDGLYVVPVNAEVQPSQRPDEEGVGYWTSHHLGWTCDRL